MQTPVEIDFQGMSARPDIQASIEQHVAALEATLRSGDSLPGRAERPGRPSPHQRSLSRSTFIWRFRKVAKSMSRVRRRRMSAMPI